MTAHPNPDRWTPTTVAAVSSRRRPEPGQLIGWRYAVWQVSEVRPVADADLDEEQRANMLIFRPEHREAQRPYDLVLTHVRGPQLVETRRLHDGTNVVHLGVRLPPHGWHVMAEHWAVCVCHGDPHPCGDLEGARLAAKVAGRTSHLLDGHNPSVCFACRTPFGPRTPVLAFPGESALVPGAAAPSFHARRIACWLQARRYEIRHRVAADPLTRRYASCPGVLFVHVAGGRLDCTAELLCTGHHGPPARGGQPAGALDCTTVCQMIGNDGGYPRPPTICGHDRCLGRDHSTGAPDPLAVGDDIAAGTRGLVLLYHHDDDELGAGDG